MSVGLGKGAAHLRPARTLAVRAAVVVAALAVGPVNGDAQTPADVTVQALANGDQIGTALKPGGRVTRGPLLDAPPPRPPVRTEAHAPLPTPMVEDRFVPPSQFVETGETIRPQAPGSAVAVRNTMLSPPLISSVAEPNVGTQNNGIFASHNWYAEISTDNGASFSYISPYAQFPSSPAAFAAGFCCDQRVAQDPTRDLIFWLLQYVKTGNTSTSTSGYRIAVAHGQTSLSTNSWQYHDFTPADFGLPAGKWLDFPQMQVSANYLYFTANVFDTVTNLFYGAVIGRIPLDALNANTSFTMNTYVTTAFGSITPVNGANTTMYFGVRLGSNSIRVLSWPEALAAPIVSDVGGLSSTTFGAFICNAPDGSNPCGRSDTRMQTGWVTATELGFMWTSAQNGAARPYPYTRVAILNPSTLAIISQPDIFSTSSAFLYPAIAVNARGHLGGTIDRLGGTVYTSLRAIIRDDLSPDVTLSGWELIPIADGNAGAPNWGDYNGVVPHERYPNTWVGVGHVQTGSGPSLRNFWLMRERDLPGGPGPVQSVALTSDRTAPQPPGATITWTAAATGGAAPLQYKWWIFDGLTWNVARDWAVGNTFAWTPAVANPNYQVGVWVRSDGGTASEASAAAPFGIQLPVSSLTLAADRTAPQPPGTTITWTASATGGAAPLQYKWWIFDGVTWNVLRDWAVGNTFAWTPAVANPNYQVGVWVRSNGASAPEAFAATPFAIQQQAGVTAVTLAADRTAPQSPGTTITWTTAATGTGGAPFPLQFKWWVFDGVTWNVMRDWSLDGTFAWTPAVANPSYQVGVWVRSNGATAPEAFAAAPFAIQQQTTVTAATLTADRTAPQPAGTTIAWTAAATGGTAPLQYKWWIFDGVTWNVLRDWAVGNTFAWTPAVANSNYQVGIWVRSNGGSAPEAFAASPFAIQQGVPAGATTLAFNGLTVDGAPVTGYSESGFTIAATSGGWVGGTGYGHPAPFILFRTPGGSTVSGEIRVSAGGAVFGLSSLDLYSSTTPIPYTITGFRNSSIVYSFQGTVPNTSGNFRTIFNPNPGTLVDTLSVVLTNAAAPCCPNPMGLDNIVLTQ